MQDLAKVLAWFYGHPPCAVLAWYALMSLLTLVLYWRDKRAAVLGMWRTPEGTLHLFELLGGWPGALIGQSKLHHKCSKVSYQVEFWIVVALNILGLLYLTYGWLTNDWHLNVLRDWIWSVSEQGESYIEIRPLE